MRCGPENRSAKVVERKHVISPRNRSPVLQPLAVDFPVEGYPANESDQLAPDGQSIPPQLSTLHASWNIEDVDDTFLRCVEKHWITSQNIRILKIVTVLWFIWSILLHSLLPKSPPYLPHQNAVLICDWCTYGFFSDHINTPDVTFHLSRPIILSDNCRLSLAVFPIKWLKPAELWRATMVCRHRIWCVDAEYGVRHRIWCVDNEYGV
jgi:hypothetical protein